MMRIGLICTDDPNGREGLSGTPFAARQALQAAGATVLDFVPEQATGGRVGFTSHSKADAAPPAASNRRQALRRLARRTPLGRALARRRMLQRVRQSAAGVHQQVRRAVAQQRVDVLVGCFASPLLYGLDAGRPLVHFSDLTFRLLVETYAWARQMPRHQRVATEAVERDVLRRCDAHLVPTRWARDSMVRDYGVQTHRIHVIPLGANLGEEATAHAPGASSGPPLPSRSGLRLTITAANAQRKRLDLAVQTTSILRRRGWNASLSCVGGQTARAREAPFVHCHGRLDHNDPQQRRQHVQLIRDSHVMMLPSEAEAFGIAPIEAAHLGVPSVVSAAGGLREVVQDRRTGRVVPVDAPADAYADAVEDLVADLPGYRACCAAAQRRAREELSWSHFASAALAVLEDLCRHHQRLRRCA